MIWYVNPRGAIWVLCLWAVVAFLALHEAGGAAAVYAIVSLMVVGLLRTIATTIAPCQFGGAGQSRCAFAGQRHRRDRSAMVTVVASLLAAGFVWIVLREPARYELIARALVGLAVLALALRSAQALFGVCPAGRGMIRSSRTGGAPLKSATCFMTGTQRRGPDGKVYEVAPFDRWGRQRWMKTKTT